MQYVARLVVEPVEVDAVRRAQVVEPFQQHLEPRCAPRPGPARRPGRSARRGRRRGGSSALRRHGVDRLGVGEASARRGCRRRRRAGGESRPGSAPRRPPCRRPRCGRGPARAVPAAAPPRRTPGMQRRVVAQPGLQLVRLLEQQSHRGGDQLRGGLVAGDEELVEHRQHLVVGERLAVDASPARGRRSGPSRGSARRSAILAPKYTKNSNCDSSSDAELLLRRCRGCR